MADPAAQNGEEGQSEEERIAWLRARGVQIEMPEDRNKPKAAGSGKMHTFKYVRIPVDPKEEITECTAQVPVEEAQGDKMTTVLEGVFAENFADDAVLESFSKSQGGSVGIEALRKTMMKGGCESFRIAAPTEDNGREAVYLYLDESGQLKGLQRNQRAVDLAVRCGYPADISLRGDMYVARVKWTGATAVLGNVDFTLADLSPAAVWARRAGKDNLEFQKSTQPEAHESAQAVLGNEVDHSEHDEGSYTWRDEGDDVEVSVSIPADVKGKDCKVTIKPSKLLVAVEKASVQLELQLWDKVVPEDSTWTVSGGKLVVTLNKVNADEAWASLTN
mmetsp:Transcript_111321/g.255318  ORF Transcript_111321/g.255318 Transcript_111321/m.255318 type:complete len:333 (+) Transcript_111321:29-1027(+)